MERETRERVWEIESRAYAFAREKGMKSENSRPIKWQNGGPAAPMWLPTTWT